MDQRSPVHEIVNALWRALHDLGSSATTGEIEQWGFSIHAALSAAGREFHNHDHVIDLVTDGDPLEVVAALYHDAVYIQVDFGPPRSMRDELTGVLAQGADGWRVLPSAAGLVTGDVLRVFGRSVGDVVTPTTGLNELASALVASIQLARALTREQRIAVAACIEQTIPFRVDPVTELHRRLAELGLADGVLDEAIRRAVRVGNRDVENFADNDPARFLDNTWKLLPESNPALHSPTVYTVRDYRSALLKMEGFLAWLPAERVFHSWNDEPRPEIHARRVARTTGNLELAVRYLRAKLYSISLVEALAEVTGGDVPVDYFMGGPKSQRPETRRIEQFLPVIDRDGEPGDGRDGGRDDARDARDARDGGRDRTRDRARGDGRDHGRDEGGSGDRADRATGGIDPLYRLLAEGRASESSFDTGPSPLAAFLHAAVGEHEIMKGVELAKRWWAGAGDAKAFLAAQPSAPVAAIARAAANIIETRRDRLFALAERLER